LFWGGNFSNWAKSEFTYKGIKFYTAEGAFMWEKSVCFGDVENANAILKIKQPDVQKQLGRCISGYNEEVWANVRYRVMLDVCREKFTQNRKLLTELLNTGSKIIVEASPYDTIWGIGLGVEDPRALDETQWLGQNLLGKVLMELRSEFVTSLE
jgi:ribA/ribD-fused uncharacterized protein